jgi:hypothetical protein
MNPLTVFISVLTLVFTQELTAQDFTFRNSKWGMDTIQVKNAETALLLYSKGNSLVYNGKLSNLDTKIVYDFTPTNNRLYQSFYIINLNSKNPSIYVKNFLMLEELLTTKYKQPVRKSANTINGKVITQDEWASNLISDNLNLETKWTTDDTEIILSLYSINDELLIEIRYTSVVYNKKADEEKKVKILKEL